MDRSPQGRRVRLISTSDPYTTQLKPGDEGTALWVDDMGTLHVEWDVGSNLGMIPGEDHWEFINDDHPVE